MEDGIVPISFRSLSSSGGVTPFDSPFQYNFSSEVKGSYIDLDLQSEIPAGTYQFSGVAAGFQGPSRIQLLNSSNTIVGSGSMSGSGGGGWDATNSATYLGNITANQGFSKLRFLGNSSGSQVKFQSNAPTVPSYHVIIAAGSRSISNEKIMNRIFASANNIVTYANSPTTVPAGQNVIPGMEWFYNGSYYTMTQTIVGNPTGSTNTIIVLKWDYTSQTWTQVASTNPSAIGMQSFATFYNDGYYNRPWVFKNGRVVIYNSYMFNTSGSGTPTYATNAWVFNCTNNSLSSLSLPNTAILQTGSSAYNPTNDEWFHFPSRGNFGVNNSYLARIPNSGSITSTSTQASNYNSQAAVFVENNATPKISISYQNSQGYGQAQSATSFASGFTTSLYNTNGSQGSYTAIHQFGDNNTTLNVGTFNSISDYYLTGLIWDSNYKFGGGTYTFPAGAAGYTQLAPYDTYSLTEDDLNDSYRYTLMPIDGNQYGLIKRPKTYSSGLSTFIIPFPTTVTL